MSLTPSEQVGREIKAYLEKHCIDYESDPLQWWSSHKDEFPVIALAKKYLCVCGTSIPSECLSVKVDIQLVIFKTHYHQILLTC